MRRIKLTAGYKEKGEYIQKTVTIKVPKEKEQDVFDFEAFLVSESDNLSMSIISSNVDVIVWGDYDDIPTEEMTRMATEVDSDLLVATCPRLPETTENVMVYCPVSMEEFITNGGFIEVFNEIRHTYESLYWTGSGDRAELLVYFKDGSCTSYPGSKFEDQDKD